MNKKPYYLRTSPPGAYEIARHWYGLDPHFVEDLEHPSCFACHYYPFGEGSPKNLQKAWRKRLQRCHIIAHSAGGSNHPENFLLLCVNCHREAPMTSDREIMLRWARTHASYLGTIFAEMMEAVKFAQLEELAHLWRDGDCERAVAFAKQHHLDFHPKSTRPERFKAIALVCREYLERKKFEQATLFGVIQ